MASLGSSIVSGTLYRYTRSMETEADAFALTTLDRMGMSARGLAKLMERLMSQEALRGALQDPYLRTHPLTRSRLNRIRRHMQRSPHTAKPTPARFRTMHARVRAKLMGFLSPPGNVIGRYAGKKTTIEARYALAIAYHRAGRLGEALPTIDELIRESPRDAFLHELKGQILLERGQARRAARASPPPSVWRPGKPLSGAYGHGLLQTANRPSRMRCANWSRQPPATRRLRPAGSCGRWPMASSGRSARAPQRLPNTIYCWATCAKCAGRWAGPNDCSGPDRRAGGGSRISRQPVSALLRAAGRPVAPTVKSAASHTELRATP